MASTCRVLLVSGSLRARSTNSAVLETAVALAPRGVVPLFYRGLGDVPACNPDDDGERLDPVVSDLRTQIRRADALLLSTPEYAGALPGSFKNLLDWTIGDDQPGSIDDKPVAWINASPRGAVVPMTRCARSSDMPMRRSSTRRAPTSRSRRPCSVRMDWSPTTRSAAESSQSSSSSPDGSGWTRR